MSISKLSKKLTSGPVRSLVITLVIATLLFMAGPTTPAQAVTPSATTSGIAYINSSIQFTVTVDIHSREQIPINNIKVCVRDTAETATPRWVTFSPSGTEIAGSPTLDYWTVLLDSAASTAPYRSGYGYGYGYGWSNAYFEPSTYGYIPCTGYGYMGTMPWKSFGYIQGYGYGGYDGGYYPGDVSLVYTVTLSTTGMSAANYNVIVDVDADEDVGGNEVHYLSSACAFTLYAAGAGGGGGGAVPGPSISEGSVSSSSVGSDSANIGWTTARPGTSQVRYSASPWVYSTLDSTLVTQHLVSLTDLEPDTTYKYQCLSKDAAGNLSTSATLTFTTLAAPEEEEAPPEEAPPEEAPPAPAPPAPAPPAPAPPTPATPINWPLIGGIIAGVIVVALVIWRVVVRKRD